LGPGFTCTEKIFLLNRSLPAWLWIRTTDIDSKLQQLGTTIIFEEFKMSAKITQSLIVLFTITLLFTVWYCTNTKTTNAMINSIDNINDISVKDMKGNEFSLSDYSEKVLLIVNVASECGNTPQYAGLERLYEKYNHDGFEILAFPCNDFGGQEPGTNEEIESFCTTNYGVTFKLFDKIKVLGSDKCSLYERLTNNNVTAKSDIKWNFEKFIISKKGKIVARFGDKIPPDNAKLIITIEKELAKD
jgi:glutathione peroxidase